MKKFRLKDRDIIINTPISSECFDKTDFEVVDPFREFGKTDVNSEYTFDYYLTFLEELRLAYLETKDEKYFKTLVSMLPNTYKLVRLCRVSDAVLKSNSQYQKKHRREIKKYQKAYAREYYKKHNDVLKERFKKYYYDHKGAK